MNKEILKSISEIVDKKISSLPYNSTFPSVIYGKENGKYKIVYEGNLHLVENSLPINLSVGDLVWVDMPNGNIKNMRISGIRNTDIDFSPSSIPTYEVDDYLSLTSKNPVQNKVLTKELNNKVDAEEGKQLSDENYTLTEKEKLKDINNATAMTVLEINEICTL